MGVVEQLKKLHKQKMIKTSDIPRVVNSGVDVDTYLSRARTLDSYINPEKDEPVEDEQEQPMMSKAMNVVEETPKVEEKKTTSTASTETKTTTTRKRSIIRNL